MSVLFALYIADSCLYLHSYYLFGSIYYIVVIILVVNKDYFCIKNLITNLYVLLLQLR